jgi:hypothetical protein
MQSDQDIYKAQCKLLFTSKQHEMYKNTNHQQMHKESFIINRNTLPEVLPEDDPAGSKHVGVCYD